MTPHFDDLPKGLPQIIIYSFIRQVSFLNICPIFFLHSILHPVCCRDRLLISYEGDKYELKLAPISFVIFEADLAYVTNAAPNQAAAMFYRWLWQVWW